MALQVGLVHDIDAVLVAQVVPRRLVGVVAGADGVDVVPFKGVYGGGHVVDIDGPAGVRAPLVAVDPVEDQPPAVEEHQAVLQLEPAEPDIVGDHLSNAPIRGGEGQRHLIHFWAVMVPGADIFKTEGLATEIFALPGQLQLAVKEYALVRMGNTGVYRPLPLQQQAGRQGPGGIVLR